MLADLDAGDVRLHRLELAPDVDRRVGLHVEHVLVRRTARQVDHNDRLVVGPHSGAGFGGEEIGEAEPAEGESAYFQELSTRESIAEWSALTAFDRQHGFAPECK